MPALVDMTIDVMGNSYPQLVNDHDLTVNTVRREEERFRSTLTRGLEMLDEIAAPELALDYLALVDPATFAEVGDSYAGEALLAVAARVGGTRLIDNVAVSPGA